MSDDYIRELIWAVKANGLAVLESKWGPGRPSRFTDEHRKGLVELATSRSKDLGGPLCRVEPRSLSIIGDPARDYGEDQR